MFSLTKCLQSAARAVSRPTSTSAASSSRWLSTSTTARNSAFDRTANDDLENTLRETAESPEAANVKPQGQNHKGACTALCHLMHHSLLLLCCVRFIPGTRQAYNKQNQITVRGWNTGQVCVFPCAASARTSFMSLVPFKGHDSQRLPSLGSFRTHRTSRTAQTMAAGSQRQSVARGRRVLPAGYQPVKRGDELKVAIELRDDYGQSKAPFGDEPDMEDAATAWKGDSSGKNDGHHPHPQQAAVGLAGHGQLAPAS